MSDNTVSDIIDRSLEKVRSEPVADQVSRFLESFEEAKLHVERGTWTQWVSEDDENKHDKGDHLF